MAVREEAKFFDMCGGHYRGSTDIDCSSEQRFVTLGNQTNNKDGQRKWQGS